MKTSLKKKLFNPFAIVIAVILGLYMVSMCIPLFWTLMTTLKEVNEFEGNGMINGVEVLAENKLWWPKHGLRLITISMRTKTSSLSYHLQRLVLKVLSSILFRSLPTRLCIQ